MTQSFHRGRYELYKKNFLGEGTFGKAYLGHDHIQNKQVAIKTMKYENDEKLDNMLDEIYVLHEMSKHGCAKYIMCYYDFFVDQLDGEDTLFMVAEYIEGQTLLKYMEDNTELKPNILWPLYYQLILGLKLIHQYGYAHRDIKLENIMIDKEENIRYIDFGFACSQDCPSDRPNCRNTCRGGKGTPLYLPPEILDGTLGVVAAQAHDIWSLGVVMYEMANGSVLPFQTDNKGVSLTGKELIDYVISRLREYPEALYESEYELDGDDRTNEFIGSVLVIDVKERKKIEDVEKIFIDTILSRVCHC